MFKNASNNPTQYNGMKKNYLFLVALQLFFVIGFTGCSDDDEGGGIAGDPNVLLVGEWHSQRLEGYELNGDEYDPFDEPYTGDGYTFEEGGTGVYEDLDYPGNGYTFTWKVSGTTLILDEGTLGEERYTIETLNSTTLVTSYTETDEYGEYYAKETYTRL